MHHKIAKKLAAGVLAGALLLTPATAFSDTAGHWAEGNITKWSQEYPILKGNPDGTFRPDDPITRGAFAGILDRFFRFQYVSDPSVFTDISGNYWETAVLKLHAADIYRGSGALAMADAPITRAQAVTMLTRAFQIETPEMVEDIPFPDAHSIPEYALPSVAAMAELGYVGGDQAGNFNPDKPITRAEFVSILSRMVEVLLLESGEFDRDVEGTVMLSAPEGAAFSGMHIAGDLIIAPAVIGEVKLTDVSIDGRVVNLGSGEVIVGTSQPEELPEEEIPAIRPEEVYTPTETTGETILFRDKYEVPIYADRTPIKVKDGDFKWKGDRLVYTGRRFDTLFGIDISAYQNRATEGEIDWEAVADDGVDFVMVRAGFRGTSTGSLNADAFYGQNIEGAMEAGLETGVYFFAQAITVEEAIEEAEFVLELLEDYEIDGPIAYDWEMHDATYRVYGTTPEMATACAIAFCERIEEAGYDAMIYAGSYVSYIKYDQGAIEKYLHWYPEYKNEDSEVLAPTFLYQMDYWQFSSNCTVDGIGGRVDGNIHFY